MLSGVEEVTFNFVSLLGLHIGCTVFRLVGGLPGWVVQQLKSGRAAAAPLLLHNEDGFVYVFRTFSADGSGWTRGSTRKAAQLAAGHQPDLRISCAARRILGMSLAQLNWLGAGYPKLSLVHTHTPPTHTTPGRPRRTAKQAPTFLPAPSPRNFAG